MNYMTEKEQEFTNLVRRYKSMIYSVCLMFADEGTSADDLVQDSLVNLWNGYDSFRGESEIKTWVYRVTLNTCISFDRKRRRAKFVAIEMVDPEVLGSTDSDSGASDARQWKMLHDRIAKLGPFDRAIVLLWLEDMSYEDIAAIVGISVKNVSVRLVRIKQKLMEN